MLQKFFLVFGILFVSLGISRAELKTYVLGDDPPDGPRSWRSAGTFERIDDTIEPGWILPVKIDTSQNLLNLLFKEGRLFPATSTEGAIFGEERLRYLARPGNGRIWSPNLDFPSRADILAIADGLQDSVAFDNFNRLSGNRGVTIYVDLGAPFPVSKIRFYPLKTGLHRDLYMKGFELSASDGSKENTDANGQPVYHLLSAVPQNTSLIVSDTSFTPQHIRYIRLRSTTDQPFEIDQLEIRGSGYIAEAVYFSNVLDLVDIANIGALRWNTVEESGSDFILQTRVGKDRTVSQYFKLNDIGEEEELIGPTTGDKEIEDLYARALKDKPGRFDKLKSRQEEATDEDNRLAWIALPESQKGRGGVDDDENWSTWSPPYTTSGAPFLVEGPRRYFQIRIRLTNTRPQVKAKVDNIAFDFSQPVPARQILGMISPNRNVDLGKTVTFTYTIRPTIDQSRDTGFDTIEITTPILASVKGVKIGSRELVQGKDYTVDAGEKRFRIQFLERQNRIATSSDVVEIVFDCAVLAYGTVFSGLASATWQTGDIPQTIEEERLGDLTVRGAEGSLGLILGEFKVTPNPFTPNGDGVNDVTDISFKVFQVVGSAPIKMAIYDASGRVVRTRFPTLPKTVENGEFHISWNGLTEGGDVVAPGIYVVRVEIKGDKKTFVTSGTVGVVY